MVKKFLFVAIIFLSSIGLCAQDKPANDITMLVMPLEKTPIQIAQDISRRYHVLLVSYQLKADRLMLYAWTGDNWVVVTPEDYSNGAFFTTPPAQSILIEAEGSTAPELLTERPDWVKDSVLIKTTNPRTLIHLLGLYFDFPFRHWNQFAKRYGYELEEINPTLQNVHWWDLRADTLFEKRARRDDTVDSDQWAPINAQSELPMTAPAAQTQSTQITTPEEPSQPAATDVEISAKAATAPALESTPQVDADPFTAEEIPAAEIVIPQEPKTPWWKVF